MRRAIIFGTNHYNTAGLVRSLGEKGVKSDLFLVNVKKSLCSIRFSRYVSRIYYLTAEIDVKDILRRDYWNERDKPICFFGSDAWISFFDANYDEFKDKLVLPNADGRQGGINRYLDKINTFPAAKKSGFDIIRTWRVAGSAKIPDDLTFPCITKGNNSTKSSKADMAVFNRRGELEAFMRDGVEYLVQEYIEKDYELNVIGLALDHGRDVYVPAAIRKIRDELQRASCYFRLDCIDNYPGLEPCIRKLLAELKYEGLFSVEILRKGGKCYFLEINLRNDACCYAYTRAGINYPFLWFLYNDGPLTRAYLDVQLAKSPFYAISFADLRNLQDGKVPPLTWIWQFITADAYMQFSIRDPIPFFHVVYKHIRHGLPRLFECITAAIRP